MFERYTEKARRVIFFARSEASHYGATSIETEHLLLGLLREDEYLARRFLHSQEAVEGIRKRIEETTVIGEKVPLSLDLQLSHDCKGVLASTSDEAERLKQWYVGTEHLLLGLLREEHCGAARLLREHGLRLQEVRDEIVRGSSSKAAGA
jgi:ATP-dependent Clp protease ATP-binding subunit ClpC